MRKHFDDAFAAVMFAAAIAVVLAGGWCLSHSIKHAKAEMPPPVAEIHIGLPQHTSDPAVAMAPTIAPSHAAPDYSYIPLDKPLADALMACCEEYGVPLHLALGLIEVESCFQVDADSGLSYGLLQLNKQYFPDKLSPADNIRAGVEYLGQLLERYGDTAAALCAYNCGHDTGARGYAITVLETAGRWAQNG